MLHFKDRIDAGKQLARNLQEFINDPSVIVIGLPRGGVVTAYEIAQALQVPLDIVVPRKIGAPHNPELAVGALTEEGNPVWNEELMKTLNLKPEVLQATIEEEKREANRRLSLYRGGRIPLNLADKTVIIVDDGIATGATMRAAIVSVRAKGASKIIMAVPVAPLDVLSELEQEVDRIICLSIPKQFWGIGQFYDSFAQTTDEEVINLMQKSLPK